MENPAIELADEATIMFLNTIGSKGNISPDIKSLFEYINKNAITSSFTREVDDTIVKIKNDKKVRKEYMTYEMRMKDLRNEAFYDGKAKGKTEGKFEATLELLQNLMHNNHCNIDDAMNSLGIKLQDRQQYKNILAKGL